MTHLGRTRLPGCSRLEYGGHAQYEALLLERLSKLRLELEDLYQDVFQNCARLHIIQSGRRVVVQR